VIGRRRLGGGGDARYALITNASYAERSFRQSGQNVYNQKRDARKGFIQAVVGLGERIATAHGPPSRERMSQQKG